MSSFLSVDILIAICKNMQQIFSQKFLDLDEKSQLHINYDDFSG